MQQYFLNNKKIGSSSLRNFSLIIGLAFSRPCPPFLSVYHPFIVRLSSVYRPFIVRLSSVYRPSFIQKARSLMRLLFFKEVLLVLSSIKLLTLSFLSEKSFFPFFFQQVATAAKRGGQARARSWDKEAEKQQTMLYQFNLSEFN